MLPPLKNSGIENLAIGMKENTKTSFGDNQHNTAGTGAYEVHKSHAIRLNMTVDTWVRNVNSYKPSGNSMDIHLLSNGLSLYMTKNNTVRNVKLQKPIFKGEGGNGYMFTLQGNDDLISNSFAAYGRHNYDLKQSQTLGNVITGSTGKFGRLPSDFHMHLSATNLFDDMLMEGDYIDAKNRSNLGSMPKHGHSTTRSVIWNTTGVSYQACPNNPVGFCEWTVRSDQFGYGYVIGTQGPASKVYVSGDDHKEGIGNSQSLQPQSLYEDQLTKRGY